MKLQDLPSPNQESREGAAVDMLVLHYTGMRTAQEALDRLRDPVAKASSHYVVDEDGSIYRLVPEDRRAWHAGKSRWRGQENINQRSIGIEIVNPGHEFGYRPFPRVQMEAVAELSREIIERHGIPSWNVVAHSDIAPERKQDPGELFDWGFLKEKGVGRWPSASCRLPPSLISRALSQILSWTSWVLGQAQEEAALKPSDAGPPVARMQESLRGLGYGVGVSGVFDAPTQAVVTAFQRHFRQEKVDGLWDGECRAIAEDLQRQAGRNILHPVEGRMAAAPGVR